MEKVFFISRRHNKYTIWSVFKSEYISTNNFGWTKEKGFSDSDLLLGRHKSF